MYKIFIKFIPLISSSISLPTRTLPPPYPTTYPPLNFMCPAWTEGLRPVIVPHVLLCVGLSLEPRQRSYFLKTHNLKNKLALANAVFLLLANYWCHGREKNLLLRNHEPLALTVKRGVEKSTAGARGGDDRSLIRRRHQAQWKLFCD